VPGCISSRVLAVAVAAGISFAGAPAAAGAPEPADLVLQGGKIYTVDPARTVAEALAVRAGRLVFVGSRAAARRWIGPQTRVQDLHGRMLLPGLIDAHIHPLDIVDLDVCDLASRALNLAQLSAFVAACVAHYAPAPGSWLLVHQWAYAAGNQPEARYPTLRAALDAASTQVRIQLLGNDGHHYAFNSLALAQVPDGSGQAVGFSKATLAREFAALRPFVGVDALGEPNGAVNEDATERVHPGSTLYTDLTAIGKVAERIPQRLNSAGITGILDAMVSPQALPLYDTLSARAQLTARVTLALFFDPSKIRTRDGRPDYDRMVAEATAIRTRYADNPLIKADVVKLFADGGLEGNPYAVPPTLPNAAALKPFLQPIFARDSAGRATVTGYVDTASALCAAVRAHPRTMRPPPPSARSRRHTATTRASVRSSQASYSIRARCCSSSCAACTWPASVCTSTSSATERHARQSMHSKRRAPPTATPAPATRSPTWSWPHRRRWRASAVTICTSPSPTPGWTPSRSTT
jgi:hypothetical protein